jgi:hypothetical protein
MSASMPATTPLTRLNAVQATSQGPLIGVNRDAEILSILKRVHAELGVKQEGAALQARVKPSQYSNAINGTGNFGMTWWYAQDDAFLLRTFELVMEARGLTPENKRAQRAFKIAELVRLLTEE